MEIIAARQRRDSPVAASGAARVEVCTLSRVAQGMFLLWHGVNQN